MDNVLQVFGFGSRVLKEEKAAESHHSTAREDGNANNATMAFTDNCGLVNNLQEISIVDGVDNPPQDEGYGSDGSSSGTDSIKSVENPSLNLLQNSSVVSAVTAQIVQNEGSSGSKSFIMSDEDDDNVSLGEISVCSGDVSKGEPKNRLPHYLLQDGGKE
eukprot:15334077-Ditylum_brightwellii.AAC.1